MNDILISGGNSGIGLQTAHALVERGHRVVLLGRDQHKGDRAVTSLGERASFIPVDLSTHAGVRDAAGRVLRAHDRFDAVVHTTGVMISQDVRTADGLSLFFAVNYLSRYHLTQLLLPALRRGTAGRVVMMTARVPVSTPVDLSMFPRYAQFDFGRMSKQIQLGNHHYAAHLARTEPWLRAGVVNAGGAMTDIFRTQPWYMHGLATAIVPLFYGSVRKAAHNAVHAGLRDDWPTATYWDKPGNFDRRTPITLDASTTQHIIDVSRTITGA